MTIKRASIARAQRRAATSAGTADFAAMWAAGPLERVSWIKRGVPAQTVDLIARRMAVPKERLATTLGIARATIDRKVRENKPLSSDESSRVLGMGRLVGQVQAMVDEAGEAQAFNAAEWVAQWLERPLPALGGRRPAEFMDTPDGQQLVSDLIGRVQSGAYA